MRARLDLNCDLGEGLDPWVPGVDGLDARLLRVVTSANVACGGHAGDERTMHAVCTRAARDGVRVGAHVSYDDREAFGRRFLDVPAPELRATVAAQLRTLREVAAAAGMRVAYVKPHGALYNALVHHEEQAAAVLAGVRDVDDTLPVVGLPGSAVLDRAARLGMRAVTEAFADRGYRADGTLVPRTEPGALVTDGDEVARRVVRMATERLVRATDGTDVGVDAESVCLHSDTEGAAALAVQVRAALAAAGVDVVPFV